MAEKSKNKNAFTVEVDDKKIELALKRPNSEQSRKAQLEYNKAFAEAIKSGALLKAKLNNVLIEQGIWTDERQARYDELIQEINEGEKKLAKGGIRLNSARDIAIDMRGQRWELRQLIAERTELESNTAEGQAENARFNYLVSSTLVYNDTGKVYFKNVDDYLNQSNDVVAITAAQKFANMMYGLDEDYESTLPENEFLKEFEFVDESLRLVNEDGNLVDLEGNAIDEFGRFIDDDGNPIDKEGDKVSDDGKYSFQRAPFLNDSGDPISSEPEEESEPEEKPKPKRRGRPKKVEAKKTTTAEAEEADA